LSVLASNAASTVDLERSHLEAALENIPETKMKSGNQNDRMAIFEKTLTKNEKHIKKLMSENDELKDRLSSLESIIRNLDTSVKMVQRENAMLRQAFQSRTEVMDYLKFQKLDDKDEWQEKPRHFQKIHSMALNESKVQSKSSEPDLKSEILQSSSPKRRQLLPGIYCHLF
jgi:predicted nuclease with TOPRIM domain